MASAVDQSNYVGTTGIGFGDTGVGRDYLSQGFKPSFTTITEVSLYIVDKDGSADIGYKVWIDNANANSEPTGTVGVGIGGATEITNAQIVTGALTRYALSAPVKVSLQNQYCIVLAPWNTTTHAFASSYHDIRSSTANPYTKGRRTHGDTAYTTWTAPDAGNDDILFEVWGERPSFRNSRIRPAPFAPGLAR